jgi:hypothetical protein
MRPPILVDEAVERITRLLEINDGFQEGANMTTLESA